MTTPCEPVKRRPRRVKPAVGTVEHVQQTGWKTVAQPTARNLPAALLSLNRRLFLALSHGSAILTQHPICSTPPLRNLPLIHRYDECLLWVETTRRRAAAYGKRISSGGFPAMSPSRRRSQTDPVPTSGSPRARGQLRRLSGRWRSLLNQCHRGSITNRKRMQASEVRFSVITSGHRSTKNLAQDKPSLQQVIAAS